MSTKVVPAPANQAKRLVRNEKLAKEQEHQQPAQDERPAKADEPEDAKFDEQISLANADDAEAQDDQASEVTELSLAGDFSFDAALADAAAGTATLMAEAESLDQTALAQDGGEDRTGGTILLVGAVALVGLGIAVLVGGNDDDEDIINQPPTFSSGTQTVSTNEDTAVQVKAPATDPDGDALTYTTSNPTNGTISGSAGTYTYTPNANFNGSDKFTVTATDPAGGTTTQTVTVNVAAVNDLPVFNAATIAASVDEDMVLSSTLATAASDVDGDALAFSLGEQAANGTVVVNSDGTYTYTPDADFFGNDSFTASVSDGKGGTAAVTVNVTVNGVADAPVFGAGTATVAVDENIPTDTVIFTGAATDADGDAITYSLGGADAAAFTIDKSTGQVRFVASPDFEADAAYTVDVVATDFTGAAGTQTLTVNINDVAENVNLPPVINPDTTMSITTAEDTKAEIIIDADDPEGGDLTVGLVTAPLNGSIVDGFYVPDADFNGADSFTVGISDGDNVVTYTVAVNVTPVNDAPVVAGTQSVAVDENTSFGVTVNATDVDGDTLAYTVTGDPTSGTVELGTAPGKFVYTPDADFNGADSFVVTVDDGNGGTATQTVNVTVVDVPGDQTTFSIDIVNPADPTMPRNVDAAADAFLFTDDASKNTFVNLTGFTDDDQISVSNADSDDYNFTTGTDPNDLRITFSDGSTVNEIIIDDILTGNDFVFDFNTAVAAVGFNFITFA